MREPLTFEECVQQSLADEEFVREFDRLFETNIAGTGSVLEREIDWTSGRTSDDLHKFVEFVHRYIWALLPPDVREPPR